ncbi:hypothetical protein [Phenylobacterium kunshanense]|uniref:Tail fiber domain-containing protein n=1 Tax=Phenylobacterium kunshanense TaxID=1445034 RepID=A0A328BB11_9CAUL|nr:hypothetical protein [Phenylobacterium kunshanense]RAK63006.1 hypothetical protein DJ019_17165 [Phenylobacterium kunshanense]
MSLKIGGSAEKSKTTTSRNSTTRGRTTPIVPDWALGPVQRGAERVGGLFDLDPQTLVAPSHALENQAAASAATLGRSNWGDAEPGLPQGPGDTSWLSGFMNADTPFASGGKAYNYMDRYVNPYLSEVVDASAADFDANAGQVRAQQALDLAGAGAFGGSGAALTQSMTEGELARGRASTLSGLRSKAWETALGAAAGDADRATQARIANAQTALQDRAQKAGFGFRSQEQQLAAQAAQRANIATQAELGATLRGVDQQQRAAPITTAQQIVAMLSGLPIGLFVGQEKDESSSETGTSKTKGVSATFSADIPLAKG